LPLYEYQCARCGRFEVIRKFSDPPLAACPTCGGEIQKLASAPAIQFKGTGWYITDYARKSGTGTDTSSKGEGGTKPAGSGDSSSKDGGGKSAASGDASTSKGSGDSATSKGSSDSTSTKGSGGGSTS
jgi:putative FmdB family regulatory protein